MHVCLSHWSALECWRSIRQCGDALPDSLLSERVVRLPLGIEPSITKREACALAENYKMHLPLQLHTPYQFRKKHREYCLFLRQRSCERTAEACELESGVYLPRPETVFIQLLRQLDAIDIAKLGYELSSSYAVVGNAIVPSKPLLHQELLQKESLLHSKRVQKEVSQALNHFMPGAESPAEINLSLKLFMPTIYGGMGLKGARLNPKVKLSETGRKITGKTHCRADIFFEGSKLDVEYDSKQWHADEQRRLEDMKRCIALQQEGYQVISVGCEDANTPENLNKLALRIAIAQNKRLRIASRDFARKQLTLFERLGRSFEPISRP